MKKFSPAAQVAKLIRQDIKSRGLIASVRSENYAGGDSVRVELIDQAPKIIAELRKAYSKYQYGKFDGMTDCYDYTNCRKDIPQTKYLFVTNEMSSTKRQEVLDYVRKTWSGGEQLPEIYEGSRPFEIRFQDQWLDTFLYQQFTNQDSGVWE